MRDLTHYFQLPEKEKESGSQKENLDFDSCDDNVIEVQVPRKVYKKLSKTKSKVDSSSSRETDCLFEVVNSEEISNHTTVRTKEKKEKSKHSEKKVTNNLQEQNEIIEDISVDQKNANKKTPTLKESQITSNKSKLKLSTRKSNKDNGSNKQISTEKESDGPDGVLEKSHNLGNKKAHNGSYKEVVAGKNAKPATEASGSTDNSKNVKDKALKTSPSLNDNNNAFFVLMSARSWISPHSDESKSGRDSVSPNKRASINETPIKSADIKENSKKRKKKLADMAEQKRIKKSKHDSCSSEETVSRNPKRHSRRILKLPESDSDDDRIVQPSRVDGNKQIDIQKHNNTGEDFAVKVDTTKTDELTTKKFKDGLKHKTTAVKQSKQTSSKPLSNKVKNSQSKDIIKRRNVVGTADELGQEGSESELKCTKESRIEELQTINAKSPADFKKTSVQVKRKLVIRSSDSEPEEKNIKRRMQRKKKLIRRDNSVTSKKQDHKKPHTSSQIIKSDSKNSVKKSSRRASIIEDDFSSEVNGSLKSSGNIETTGLSQIEKCNKTSDESYSETKREEPTMLETDSLIYDGINKDKTKEETIKAKAVSETPLRSDDSKKRNSLFSYFNKVSKQEAISNSAKIEVKAQVHSPPASPSTKRRSSVGPKLCTEPRRQSSRIRISDKEDQIIVLESSVINSTESSTPAKMKTPQKIIHQKTPNSSWRLRVKLWGSSEKSACNEEDDGDANDDSDDNIFLPRKKVWSSCTKSAQQKAAREVVRKAKATQRKSLENQATTVMRTESRKSDCGEEESRTESDIIIMSSSMEKKKPEDPPVKLAPLFLRKKPLPKPKLDPAVLEARKMFLKSGVPEPVKKLVDMQRSMEEQYEFTFPVIAHIQQRSDTFGWNLPVINLPTEDGHSDFAPLTTASENDSVKLGTLSNSSRAKPHLSIPSINHPLPAPATCYRKLLHLLKKESPHFPVYRSFRRLKSKISANIKDAEKHGEKESGPKQNRKSGRRGRVTRSSINEDECKTTENGSSNSYVMWTEKYKPMAAEDIIANGYSVEQLKKWLESWKRCNDEILRKDKGTDRKRKDSSSGDEFVNSDSNDSTNGNLPNNTAILVGPHGCGKTAAVYAIANELGCKVLEINASSKRNGKRILSELQEATQSHQLRAGSENVSSTSMSAFLKGQKPKPKKRKPKTVQDVTKSKQDGEDNNSKMSIILVEGADVVYEDQDEGFVSALNTLVASSKRPVILVTNNPYCSHLSRFMDLQLVLRFSVPSITIASVWLQLICLLEGVRVNRAEIEKLLDNNQGDVRRTMLQLQFWVLTGGNHHPQEEDNFLINPPQNFTTLIPSAELEDDHSNLSWASNEEADDTPLKLLEHSCCIEKFTEYAEDYSFNSQIPFPLDLGQAWWNLTSLLGLPENLYHAKETKLFREVLLPVDKNSDVEEDCKDNEVTRTEEESETFSVRIGEESGCDLERTNNQTNDIKKTEDEKINVGIEEESELNSETACVSVTKEDPKATESTINKVCGLQREDSGICLSETVVKSHEEKEQLNSESEAKSKKKTKCSQLETDSISRLFERLSTLDVIMCRSKLNNASRVEPCARSWDQSPKDGTSLTETVECNWWENSVSRQLCHRMFESSVYQCRSQLEEARGCEKIEQSSKITFSRPLQQELRWRLTQHTAVESLLPAVALSNQTDHHAVAAEYFPMLRAISRCEQERLTTNTKRRNRFFHYLKGLNIHASDVVLDNLCSMFSMEHRT